MYLKVLLVFHSNGLLYRSYRLLYALFDQLELSIFVRNIMTVSKKGHRVSLLVLYSVFHVVEQ